MSQTRILVSNDDGIDAPGLQQLVEELCTYTDYDVRVGAPAEERSGSSHAFSSPITATVYTHGKTGLPSHVRAYCVDGYPADAVRLAFVTDVFEDGWRPEVVVAGVNRGLNAGKYLVMSGTLGAAREGAMHGAKAVAVSLHAWISKQNVKKEHYKDAVKDFMPILKWIINEHRWPPNVFLNINLPHPPSLPMRTVVSPVLNNECLDTETEGKGLIVVPQGQSTYGFKIRQRQENSGEATIKTITYRYQFEMTTDFNGTVETDDLIAVMANYTTLTPLPIGVQDNVQLAMELLEEWRRTNEHPRLQWHRPT